MPETLASLYVFFILFGVFIAILWVLMPFAVFGIKGKLDELISLQRQQLALAMKANSAPGEIQ